MVITNKRKAVRRPVRYTAWIAREGKGLLGCVLSDISATGARIDVSDAESLPDDFMLFLSSRGAARRRCHVAWRKPGQLGVKFQSAPPRRAKPVAPALADFEDTAPAEPAEDMATQEPA
jgi:hypothetical protein